ncbi:MAG TPA: FtsX-like permease family protein [Candidatus Acidoferrales bacterium]|nr:FtsX-like permease family protein [Candidatus Acidoferrales bacterium]
MMFWRLLFQLLRGSRGRLAVALVALVSGAAVISALMNLDLDIGSKLTEEFRTLGANVVIAPLAPQGNARAAANSGSGGSAEVPALMDQSTVLGKIKAIENQDIVAAAPYLYIIARAGKTQVVVAGTWLDAASKLAPTWKVDGNLVASRDDQTRALVGRSVARELHLARGSEIALNYLGRIARLTVAGVVDAGGPEDNQVFVNLAVAQQLANLDGQIGLVQLNIRGNAKKVADVAAILAGALPGYDVRPIREVAEAEGALLGRVRLLIFSMVALILVLTALCVLATMAALAIERREDVGLMKALGGSISRVVGLFLAEVGVLGAVGGLIGCIVGLALSRWMGQRVFGATISVRWEIFPLTIGLMIVVALAGASPLRMLGKVKPAVIFRGE